MKGTIAAIPTPIDAKGQPISDLLLEHAWWALDNGCDGLNILGSTGEASSFGIAQRKEIMAIAASNLPLEQLMVGTGTPALSDSQTLTTYAAELGYRIALVLPPYYYKPASDIGLKDWYFTLDRILGMSELQLYFYNYPQITGIELTADLVLELHAAMPERFAGIKDSSGDLSYCSLLAESAPNLAVFPSSETSLANAHVSGFAGCISATANITASTCARVYLANGNASQADIQKLELQRSAVTDKPLIPAIKYLVGLRAEDKRWERVLPPLQELDDDQKSTLKQFLR